MTHPAGTGPFLRVDEIWLSREPLDMRCGPETTLARVVQAFGAAKPHCAYVFANKRANRMKILLCDGFGIWLLARRLHQGRFIWSALRNGDPVALDDLQLQALASGLPWQYASADFVIDRQ
jgi:transposase